MTMAANGKNGKSDSEGATVELSFVAAIFDDVSAAKEAYKALKDLNREGLFDILAAAYMEKTDRSKIKVHEYKDWSGKKGAVVGGGVGAIVGIIGSTVLLPLTVGALIGGTLAHVHDTKFSNKDLNELANTLPPGTSALVAIVEDDSVEPVEEELTKEGGKKVHSGEVPKSTLAAVDQTSKK